MFVWTRNLRFNRLQRTLFELFDFRVPTTAKVTLKVTPKITTEIAPKIDPKVAPKVIFSKT